MLQANSRFRGWRKPVTKSSNYAALLADWTARSTGGSVCQVFDYTTDAQVMNYRHIDGKEGNIVRNAAGGPRGTGSLRINVEATDGASSGAWRCPLDASWTLDTQGIGSDDFYIQYWFMLGPNRFNADSITGGSDNGFKIQNIAEYRQSSPNSSESHPLGEMVLQFHGQESQRLIAYRDTASASAFPERQSAQIFTVDNSPEGGDIRHQNAVDNGAGVADKFARYCLYQSGSPYSGLSVGCVQFEEGVRYTIYEHIKVVTPNGKTGNIFEVSYAGPGDSSYRPLYSLTDQLQGADPALPNWNNGNWFLPYKTDRISGAATWHEYGDFIASRAPIACPMPSN